MPFCFLCVRLILLISHAETINMKKIFSCIIALCMLSSCSKEATVAPRPSYNLLIPVVEHAPSLESLATMALSVEGRVASAAATYYAEGLPDDYMASRDSFYVAVEKKMATFRKGHFVELRTVLYEKAAEVLATIDNPDGVAAMKHLLKRCSAVLYIDGQRACDPPKSVRERYEQAKRKTES